MQRGEPGARRAAAEEIDAAVGAGHSAAVHRRCRHARSVTPVPRRRVKDLHDVLRGAIAAVEADGIQRINQLWFVTYVNEGGQEIVVQAKAATGEYVPLIAVDSTRLESIMAAARGLAKANNLKMRLIKFTNRLDVEDIAP